MKVYIKIKSLPITASRLLFPPLANYGWEKILNLLCDEIIQSEKMYDGYKVYARVSTRQKLMQRIQMLPSESLERIECIAYPSLEQKDSYLSYDYWIMRDEDQLVCYPSQVHYQDTIFSPLSYQDRKWLNEGEEPDHPSYYYGLYIGGDEEDNDFDYHMTNNENLNEDDEIYATGMYRLFQDE